MSKLITKIQNRLKEDEIKKTIILPEAEDERVLKAALRVLEDNIINIILVGDNEKIVENLNNDNINEKSLDIDKYIKDGSLKIYDVEKEEILYNNLSTYLYDLRKHKGLTLEEAEKLTKDEVYFGILMLKKGLADGLVSGAIHSTKDTLRPTLQIIGVDKNKSNIVSSFFIMEMSENRDNSKNILKYDEYLDIPKMALREAIVNCYCHRDWTLSGDIKIEFYDDRVQIFSPRRTSRWINT